MKMFQLATMTKGWLVGDFEPTSLRTDAAEVAVKTYAAGAVEARHMHRIATEVTLVLEGEVEMNGGRYRTGDIVVIAPGEATDFRAVTDVTTVVVKVPSVKGDKFEC